MVIFLQIERFDWVHVSQTLNCNRKVWKGDLMFWWSGKVPERSRKVTEWNGRVTEWSWTVADWSEKVTEWSWNVREWSEKKNDWIVWECRWVVWKGGWMAGMCFLIVSLSFSWLNKRSLACFWSKQYNGAFQILKHERISHVDFLLSFRMIALTGCLLHLASWNIFRTYGCLHGCLIFFRIFTFFL